MHLRDPIRSRCGGPAACRLADGLVQGRPVVGHRGRHGARPERLPRRGQDAAHAGVATRRQADDSRLPRQVGAAVGAPPGVLHRLWHPHGRRPARPVLPLRRRHRSSVRGSGEPGAAPGPPRDRPRRVPADRDRPERGPSRRTAPLLPVGAPPQVRRGRQEGRPLEGFPGLDLKGVGGYVVGAGSLHPEIGEPYEWLRHPREGIATLLGALEAIMRPARGGASSAHRRVPPQAGHQGMPSSPFTWATPPGAGPRGIAPTPGS